VRSISPTGSSIKLKHPSLLVIMGYGLKCGLTSAFEIGAPFLSINLPFTFPPYFISIVTLSDSLSPMINSFERTRANLRFFLIFV